MRRVAVGYRTICYLPRVFKMAFKAQNERGRASRRRAIRIALLATMLICSGPHPSRAADGDLDKSFGNGGIVKTDFQTPVDPNGAFNEGRTVAIQADGKIVAGGEADHNGRTMDAVLGRYNRDGSLDTTFGTGGKVITPGVGGLDTISIQSDGKIVAATRGGLLRY